MISKGIRFVRIRGRVIPMSRDKIAKRISNRKISNHYTSKGLESMIDDLPNAGSMIHKKANMKMIARHMPKHKDIRKQQRATEIVKKFLRENRK